MKDFKSKIMDYEQKYNDLTYIAKTGDKPIILTAVHTMMQLKPNGEYKKSEPYTKAIVMYVAEKVDCFYLIKNKDTGIDSNSEDNDTFKNMLLDTIKDNNIKLVIDLHGAKRERGFDVELGTLDNLSSDYSTIKELIDSFNENGIFNVRLNSPFKGGAITKKVFSQTDIDVVQIEVNADFRNIDDADKIEQICNALINFIEQYNNIINK